jgi:hypothetical protein
MLLPLLLHLQPYALAPTHLCPFQLAHMDFVWDRNAMYKKELVELMFRFSPGTF